MPQLELLELLDAMEQEGGTILCGEALNTSGSQFLNMNFDTHISLFLLGELVLALIVNPSDKFSGWLSGGVLRLGEPVVEEV